MNLPIILVDVILLVVILLGAFSGYRKGAVATLISLVGGIAALFLATLLAPPVSSMVSENFVRPAIKAPITEAIESFAAENRLEMPEILAAPPAELSDALSAFGVDLSAIQGENLIDAEEIAEKISAPMADTLSYGICYFLLLIVFLILVRILISFAKKFNKLPLIGSANRTLGLILGLLQGLVVAWVCSAIVHLFVPYLTTQNAGVFSAFEENSTVLYRLLYQFNPIAFVNETLLTKQS